MREKREAAGKGVYKAYLVCARRERPLVRELTRLILCAREERGRW